MKRKRLSQSKERKKASKRFCCSHQLHFIGKHCPLCEMKSGFLTLHNYIESEPLIIDGMVKGQISGGLLSREN